MRSVAYALVLIIYILLDTMILHHYKQHVYHKFLLMILEMLQQLAYSYVLIYKLQEFVYGLALQQSIAMFIRTNMYHSLIN